MELKLRQNDDIRIAVGEDNFVDCACIAGHYGMRVTGYPSFHYIEVRLKNGVLGTFYFKNKRSKKEIDLGWWDDAEVVYSINNVHHSRQ